MRYLLLMLVLFFSGITYALPIDSGAIINDKLKNNPELYNEVANLIRAYGYSCDSLSGLVPMIFSRGYTVSCNNFSYSYDIKDQGGNWVVTLN
ncbi:hypothetical protein [Photobacterium phosphoreum]|uniref:hypothetical protein n=1 Tax=Photobacterium phosphoreum TaxID=659 RepID=UPI001E5CA24F|nr:hypothetical protein [Photobacterium phosphoreum]MCD9472928.1 hypothetical protein [Photobacterium phosphoreum]